MNVTLEATTIETPATSADNELVNAIRDSRIVQLPWEQLTEEEKRQARVNLFHIYGGLS